ncbi:MAG TPA: ABC transporter permease, partial [Thermoanaerobaculia bacterium]|nr:ABC transporter permease [Thermoanaerobaculia bacterium]
MRSILQDLRYAGRLLTRSPAFTLLTVLTLALGIGGSAAIFSVVDSVLLQPLPYKDSDRLMFIHSQFVTLDSPRFWVSAPEYVEYRGNNQSFEEMGAYVLGEANIAGRDTPVRANAAFITASLLRTLGVAPQIGSFFTPEQDLPNAEQVVLLGHNLWRRLWRYDVAGGAVTRVSAVTRSGRRR